MHAQQLRGYLHETNDGDDLDEGKGKLGLSVTADTEQVDGDDHDIEEGNPSGGVDIRLPEFDCDGSGDDFEGQDDEPLHGVVPTHGEAPGGIDEAGGVGSEGTSDGEEDGHLTEGVDGGVQHDTDEGECDDDGGGTTGAEGSTRPDEQTGACAVRKQ